VIKLVLWRRKGSLRSPTFQGKQVGRRLQHGGKCGSDVCIDEGVDKKVFKREAGVCVGCVGKITGWSGGHTR
jgi:hypothetical protein